MWGALSVRLGARNLTRHRWRTTLTLAGIAVSVALMVWTLAITEGWLGLMVQGATSVDTGQLQLHTAGWAERPRVYQAFELDEELLDRLRRVPGVEGVSPRVELFGLVGHERSSVVARVVGVDPNLEATATPVPDAITEGAWLASVPADSGAREVVLGQGMADQLSVGPGDELVVFAEAADGSLGNDLLRVVGLVETGNSSVDRGTVFMHLEDARWLAALDGRANTLVVKVGDSAASAEVADAVALALDLERSPEGMSEEAIVVRTWQELMPSLSQILALSRQSYWTIYLFVYLVAAVGILNTQRMSALERRREFGMMVAIGMRPRRLLRTLLVEATVLGFVGAVLGMALGTAVSWYHATAGLDLGLFTDQAGFSYMGVAFTDRLFARLSATIVIQPVVVMLVVAILSGLWPAWTAARLEPAPTLAGRL